MKGSKERIVIGAPHVYLLPYSDAVPTEDDICKSENLLGRSQGGATLEYKESTYEEKDDHGRVSKIVVTEEEALLKLGLLTFNGESLKKLISRCKTTTEGNRRITKIGGSGNAQGGYYAVCCHVPDDEDGDIWVTIVGKNTAGATLAFAKDKGTKLEPQFKAIPHDENGTLIRYVEEIGEAAAATSDDGEDGGEDVQPEE